MKEALIQYWGMIFFLIPLGAVGVWRWSTWLLKKSISFFYRMPEGNFYSTLSIVTPVYNEDPDMFRLALESWKLNEPDEIIAVIDYSNPDLIGIFENFSKRFDGAKLFVTHVPGKRAALADGIRMSQGEIVALVDSDTIWDSDIKRKLLAPFSDPEVGGLTTRQDILQADTLARKLFKVMLDDRYLFEYPFLSTVSDALLCLSGRTAVYRRIAVADKVDGLVGETFWGKEMISGDDKTLTNMVHADGWKTRFLRDVKVYTPGMRDLPSFLKQKLRWARNGLRSDSRVLASRWLWKRHKMLALHMIDKLIAAITILLAPVYFIIAIYNGFWEIALIIFCWWIVSRCVKIYPHLKERPSDIFILPLYILMTFVMAVVKIYAFFTLDKQGWITRWDQDRLRKWNPLRQSMAYVMTALFIGGYFFAVEAYQKKMFSDAPFQKEVRTASNVISQEPRLVSDAELALKRESMLSDKKDSSYGSYLIRPGDTLLTLKQRFNLPSVSAITYENHVAIMDKNMIPVGKKIMIPVSDLQKTLNADELFANRFYLRRSLISFDKNSNTVYLKGGGSVVTLTDIKRALLGNKSILEEIKKGEWILRSNMYIGKNVTLVLDKRDVTYLKLKSDESGHIWILSQGGNVLISNTKITSWDEGSNFPDLNHADGRSYITAKGTGRMDVVNSEIGFLGYEGLPRRGGPFGGSYGLSWKITNGTIGENLLTGSVINSLVHDNYFGLYTFGATGIIIKNNEVFKNVQYGIDPHDDSNNFLIVGNNVHDNGNHGIIISKRCVSNEISNNISYNNRLHGIMLDKNSDSNIVQGNIVFGNVDGIALYESDNNLIVKNDIYQNKQGIRLNSGSSSNYIEKNQITSNGNGIHVYGGASRNMTVDNVIKGNNVGLSIQDALGNAFYASLNHSENKKDAYLNVDEKENEIK